MKRASYRAGVEHIALNDDPGETDADVVAGTLTVGLLAELFGKSAEDVAQDVVRYRNRHPFQK